MKGKVMFGVATLRGLIPPVIESLDAQRYWLMKGGYEVAVNYKWGDGCIARARNEMAAEFMASDAEWLVFLSDDIEIVAPGNAVYELVAEGHEFSGGLYPKSMLCDDPRTSEALEPQPLDATFPWREMRYMSSGLWCLRRAAFERLKELPLWCYADSAGGREKRCYFMESVEDGTGRFLTEDYTFCRNYRKMGGRIWAHMGMVVHHWGMAPFALKRKP